MDGLGGLCWAERCRVASWVSGGLWGAVDACGGGALRWGPLAFLGALRTEMGEGRVLGAEWVSGLLGHAQRGMG